MCFGLIFPLASDNLDTIIVAEILYGLIDEELLNDLIRHLKKCDSAYYGQVKYDNDTDVEIDTISLLDKIDRQIKWDILLF